MCESEPIWDKINVFVSLALELIAPVFYHQEKFYAGKKVADIYKNFGILKFVRMADTSRRRE